MPGQPDRRTHHSLRIRPPGSGWIEVGGGGRGGLVAPSQISAQADASGPTSASFAIASDPRSSQVLRDLQALTEVELEVAGRVVWGGRIQSPPGYEDVLRVQAQGWQYHLDDDQLSRTYMRWGFGDFTDMREVPEQNLTRVHKAGSVTLGARPVIGWPQGAVIQNDRIVGVQIDLGPDHAARGCHVTAARISAATGDINIYVRGANAPGAILNGPWTDGYVANITNGWAIGAAHLAYPCRYIAIFLHFYGAGGTLAAEESLRLDAIRIALQPSYLSAGNSALYPAEVARTIRAALCPALSTYDGLIDPDGQGTFAIPELYMDDATARAYLEAVNAYYGWRLGVDAQRRLFFLPQTTTPVVMVGGWGGSEISGLAAASVDELYNRVIVRGTDAWGQRLRVVRDRDVPVLNSLGLRRSATLDIGSVSDATGLGLIGDVWLGEYGRVAYKGTITVRRGGARLMSSGAPIHPSHLLEMAGQRLRIVDAEDPDTGNLGRDVLIASVDYDAQTETATLSIDREVRRLEPLLARLAVVSEERVSSVART
jgi:hypothetical protein